MQGFDNDQDTQDVFDALDAVKAVSDYIATIESLDPEKPSSIWNRLIGPVYTVPSLAKAMKVDEFKIAELEAKGKFVTLHTADEHAVFPAFQFTEDMKVLPGLMNLWTKLNKGYVSEWTAVSWLLSKGVVFDGESPLDQLSKPEMKKRLFFEVEDANRGWRQ